MGNYRCILPPDQGWSTTVEQFLAKELGTFSGTGLSATYFSSRKLQLMIFQLRGQEDLGRLMYVNGDLYATLTGPKRTKRLSALHAQYRCILLCAGAVVKQSKKPNAIRN